MAKKDRPDPKDTNKLGGNPKIDYPKSPPKDQMDKDSKKK